MADFTDGFWDLYIALLALASLAGCGILAWSRRTRKHEPAHRPQ